MTDTATLLPFQRKLLSEIVPTPENPRPDDSLLILARGLGLRAIIANFLKVYDSPDQLVLVLNATEEEEKGLSEDTGLKFKSVSHEMAATVRQDLYKGGGICSVTSRIVSVDMLMQKIPTDLITGIVVLHAEMVTPTSLEAFIVRIYREANKTGFLKAFSDFPEHFTFGMSPLQTVLTQLKIRTVNIWPRFRDEVSADLVKRKADVVELYQPLTPAMRDIQNAVIDCMEATLSEIKRSNHSLDVDDLTVENALFKSFDKVVRTQLNPVWHSVGPKTKQLVSDLTTLRKLQAYLLAFDCVSFNRYLETILSSNSTNPNTGAKKVNQSPWLFTPAADTIFTVARNRVYLQNKVASTSAASSGSVAASSSEGEGKEKAKSSGGEPDSDDLYGPIDEEALAMMENMNEPIVAKQDRTVEEIQAILDAAERKKGLPPGVEPVLEEQPKWSLLADVLEEIETALHWSPIDVAGVANDTILIMCNSTSVCSTLREYLSSHSKAYNFLDPTPPSSDDDAPPPPSAIMREKLREYFWWKTSLGKMSKNLFKTRGGSSNHLGGFNKNSLEAKGAVEIENPALKKKAEMRGQAPRGKRRRVRGGAGIVVADLGRDGVAATSGSDPNALEAEASNLADLMEATSADIAAPAYVNKTLEHVSEAFDEVAFNEYFGLLSNETLVIIRPYNGDDDDRVLEELRPTYVVMYDPDPSFVRRIETFRAAHQGLSMRVYFLMYKDSVEEQLYLSSIRKEKDAFSRLIREKTTMAMPHLAEYRVGEQNEGDDLRTYSTRVGGGKQVRADPPRIIVDMREFRSSLPNLLHEGRFQVVPLTISIGDYIITPEMCVERKSLPDLISSFNSGRLYQQCELMTAHYKQPILLIEFDEKKSFSLETYAEPKSKNSDGYQSETDLRSKIVLLTISFPRLKVIWSSSPYHTVEIFRDLKENRSEPVADHALSVGLDELSGGGLIGPDGIRIGAGGGEGGMENGFNTIAQDMLRSLPGVSTKNYRYIMSKVDNIEALCEMELKEIQELIGNEQGKILFGFINREINVKE